MEEYYVEYWDSCERYFKSAFFKSREEVENFGKLWNIRINKVFHIECFKEITKEFKEE